MPPAVVLFSVLILTIAGFIWNRWRYDIVACTALLVLLLLGIVPHADAFSGFENPAVITVACVMIITQVITETGLVDYVVKQLTPVTQNSVLYVGSLTLITALLSAFMNNVGALALMMPVAIQSANKSNRSPSMILMPLAFGSVLGGLTTAIGTPPNLLISAYRQQVAGHAFAMFDFAPVGFFIAVVCIFFIAIIGWRLLPYQRKVSSQSLEMFKIQDYITEIRVPENSDMLGKTFHELEALIEGDISVLGMIRGKRKRLVIPRDEILQENDVLLIEATHDDLEKFVAAGKFELVGGETVTADTLRAGDIGLVEAVVPQGSRIEGRSWQKMRVRSRFRINLLAISRHGTLTKQRLNHTNLRPGDVVLLQGDMNNLSETIVNLGLLPLVERGVQVGMQQKALVPMGIFITAIVLAATQVLPVQIAFACAVIMMVLTKSIPVRKLYASVDWSIIVLLAALIPVGHALQTTGATAMLAKTFLSLAGTAHPIFLFLLLLIVTMTLSDVMNNAATAVVMAPVAVGIANAMQVSVDPFLMTVAVGSSCSFLTPISHQNNTLVMGPGGYKFTDYLRLGLPIELLVILVGLPTIMHYWPI